MIRKDRKGMAVPELKLELSCLVLLVFYAINSRTLYYEWEILAGG